MLQVHGEWETGNGKRGMGNGEWGMGWVFLLAPGTWHLTPGTLNARRGQPPWRLAPILAGQGFK